MMQKWSHKCWVLNTDENADLMMKHRDDIIRCFWGRAFTKEYECVEGFRAALCKLFCDLEISFFPSEDFKGFPNMTEDLEKRLKEKKIDKDMDTGEMMWRQVIDELSNAPFRIFEIPHSKTAYEIDEVKLKPNVFVEWGYVIAKKNLEHIIVVNKNIERVPFPSDLSNTFQLRGDDADSLIKDIVKHLELHHSIYCANERFAKLWWESEEYEKDIWKFLLNSAGSSEYCDLSKIAKHLCKKAKKPLVDADAKVSAFLGKYREFIEEEHGKVRAYPDYATALYNFVKSKVTRLPNSGIVDLEKEKSQ